MAEAVEDIVIARDEGETKGRYSASVDGHVAEMTYTRSGERTIIIDHTGVPSALAGRGVGTALVARAVADARSEGRSIIPLCPFAKATIAKRPEWQDVLRR